MTTSRPLIMKGVFTAILLILLVGFAAAQTTVPSPSTSRAIRLGEVDTLIDTTTGSLRNGEIVTNKTLNHYAAKRQAYYLTGATNLSLFKNFAIADISSGVLQVGQNFSLQKDADLINNVFTVALQSNIANNLTNLFAKDKIANDLGVPVSFTFFLTKNTYVGVNPDDTKELNKKRAFKIAMLKAKAALDVQLVDNVANGKPQFVADTAEAKKAIVTKAISDFYDSELAFFEADTPSFRTAWFRLQGFVPLSGSTYQVAPAGSLDFSTENTRKWSAALSLGYVRENTWNWGGVFATATARIIRTNAVEQQASKVTTYTQYNAVATQVPTSMVYYNGDGKKVYVGDLGEAWALPLQLQAIYFFKSRGDTKVGLDVQLEQYTLAYNKTNLLFGVPLFLKGKEDKGVNLEAQLRWRDLDKKVLGSDRFTVGLLIALPFGSIVK